MSQSVRQIFCQRCLAANSLGQELCGKCGTRLMLVVEPTNLRFEEEASEGAPPAEFLLERLSTLEGRLLRMAERLEQTLDLMLRQARTTYLDHTLIETIIDALDEAGLLDRKRVLAMWRERSDREEEESARAARRAKLKERVVSLYRGPERDEFARLVQEGFDLFGKGDAAKGLRALERAAALAPDNAPLNAFLGERLYVKGRAAPARDYFSRALEADPENARLRLLLGLACADEGDGERARSLLGEAAGALGRSFAAHCALGRLSAAESDWKGARAEFKLALRDRPGPEAHYLLGLANFQLGRDRTAPRPSKRAAEGSTSSIRRVPQRPHKSSPSSLGDLHR